MVRGPVLEQAINLVKEAKNEEVKRKGEAIIVEDILLDIFDTTGQGKGSATLLL